MRSIALLVVILSSAAAAADVPVAAAPPISAAPEHGLDPDVVARFASADALVNHGELAGALDAVLVLYRSSDPFSEAQRAPAVPAATELLTRIGQRANATGDLVLAARAFDARWTLTRRNDPDLARALVAWSERERSKEHALYLARRARLADPDLVAAARRDAALSHNRRAWPGRLLVVAGAIALGAGLYADIVGKSDLATAIYITAPVLTTTGVLVEFSGTPGHVPSSPAELPTLPDRGN